MKLPITVVLFIGSFAFGVAALNTPACTPWSSPQAPSWDNKACGQFVDEAAAVAVARSDADREARRMLADGPAACIAWTELLDSKELAERARDHDLRPSRRIRAAEAARVPGVRCEIDMEDPAGTAPGREERGEAVAACSAAAGRHAGGARRPGAWSQRGLRRARKTEKGLLRLYARQSKPVKLDPTVSIAPRGGRYFIYRPPRTVFDLPTAPSIRPPVARLAAIVDGNHAGSGKPSRAPLPVPGLPSGAGRPCPPLPGASLAHHTSAALIRVSSREIRGQRPRI